MKVHPELLSKTSEELRAMAAECARRSQESFDRCDTDGFLSQWASDLTARLYRHAAALADAGWTAEFRALFDLDGNLLNARIVETRYGPAWLVTDDDGDTRWVNWSRALDEKRERKHYEKHGVRVGTVRRRVVPAMDGSGKGLSGTAWPSHIIDRDYANQVEIVSTDALDGATV